MEDNMKIKATISLIIIAALTLLLCACGNMSMGIGNYTYEKIHIMDYGRAGICATVEAWYDSERGIEVRTTEYGSLFLSEGTYILLEGKCPFCD